MKSLAELSENEVSHSELNETPSDSHDLKGTLVSVRCVLLGLVIVVFNTIWILHMERVKQGPYPTTISLFLNAIFILVALQCVNAGLRRLRPSLAFGQMELLTVYSMVAMGSAVAGLDFVSIVPQVAADPYHYATPENHWASLIWPYLPRWLTVADLHALKGYYEGNTSFYKAEHLRAWATPVAAWTLFVMMLLWTGMCLNVLVRRQWQDHERLSYPLIQIPIEMTRPGAPLYRQPAFWIGACLVGAMDLLNGFATWYPTLPAITVRGTDLITWFPNRPWNAIWWMPLNYFPFVIGLGFLLPIDLLFSCWFFYVFWKLERVVFSSGGWDTASNFPYINEQCFGAYAAIVGFSLWAGRRTYGQVWRRALGKPSEVDDSGEALGFRTALVGAVAGTLGLIAFSIAAGLSPFLAVVFFAGFWMLMLAVARIRAELGPPVHDLHFTGPDHMIPVMFGTRNLSGGSMAVLCMFFWFNRAYRSSPMPVMTESLAIAHKLRSQQRRMLVALLLAGFVGTVSTFWVYLHNAYALGTTAKMTSAAGMGAEGFRRMQQWMNNPEGPTWAAVIAVGVGCLISLGLMVAHTSIPGWPFHAMGFAISGSWSMNLVWYPLFLAWVCKLLVIRYGGVRGYRTALNFFLGLIIGEGVVGIGWSLYQFMNDVPIYNFFGQ